MELLQALSPALDTLVRRDLGIVSLNSSLAPSTGYEPDASWSLLTQQPKRLLLGLEFAGLSSRILLP
jgi:hypothetical protein